MSDYLLNYDKNCWSVIEKMFKRNGGNHLVEHQISSYNNFISHDLSKMLTNHDPMILSYDYDEERKLFNYEIEIRFGKISSSSLNLSKFLNCGLDKIACCFVALKVLFENRNLCSVLLLTVL